MKMRTMQANGMPSHLQTESARVVACDCVTPLGTAAGTLAALLRGERALAPVPVLGREGGEPVPLALLPGRALDETVPPGWLPALQRLLAPAGPDWGRPRRPVIVTSSNFGVGSLYAYRRTGDKAHVAFGALPRCLEFVRAALGWGTSVSVYSHACVSAHLGLLQATRLLAAGAADAVLVCSFDFLSPFVAGGFHALKILNGEMPAPYQARAVGSIGLGDGAAFAVLGRAGTEGGFRIGAQQLHNELFHFTANRPDGGGFATALAGTAAAAAGRRVWVKGHGTGTLEAGRLEAEALAAAFPGAPLVGWKGSLGHTLGSCGLVELALAMAAVRAGRTPGTVGSAGPTFTGNVALESFPNGGYDGVICASNAFGGAHAVLLLTHA
jgi:3-oxoacyl-(acyl-carrier-protein) synthase